MPIEEAPGTLSQPLALPDYLSTLRTRELQDVMRRGSTLPVAVLPNRGQVTVDYATRRIFRDCFWKGSFARDTPMGIDEWLLRPKHPNSPPYAGGRFWKRIDKVAGGEAFGYVVNYAVGLLPGHPVIRMITYPDGRRSYVAAGEEVLMLTYLNHPYRIVYDLIKVLDENTCVGVMHLGTFPNGFEFASFVMVRHNYPFENMTVPDHDGLFDASTLKVPDERGLDGSWRGYVVISRHPERTLHNQFNPPLLRLRFQPAGGGLEARGWFGPVPFRRRARFESDRMRLTGSGASSHEIRQIDEGTLLGRRVRHGRADEPTLRYVLRRVERG